MRVRWLLLFSVLMTVLANVGAPSQVARATPARPAATLPANCTAYPQASGSTWKICQPTIPNGMVVVWAHGYEAPGFAPTYQDEILLADGSTLVLSDFITSRGFVFLSTTYPANGLVVLQAKEDLQNLVSFFKASVAPATPKIILAGASMGGLITTQLAEASTSPFDGALALCAVNGDFQRQINYWGDFNALYRTFFADVVAGWSTQPGRTTDKAAWEDGAQSYQGSIALGMTNNMTATTGLLATSNAPTDAANPASVVTTVLGLSYFTFLSDEDSAIQLGGNLFDNHAYWYRGLLSPTLDMNLNRLVSRRVASPAAVSESLKYETTGGPKIPLVTAHTTLDPIVRVDQSLLYILKAQAAGSTSLSPFLVERYGHCSFTSDEIAALLGVLLSQMGIPLQADAGLLQLPPTLITGAELAAIVEDFAAAEAAPDPYTFTQLRMPMVDK